MSSMIPAFLIRSGIDWVRHNEELLDSNPYSRCEETIRICQTLFEEAVGKADPQALEPAIISAYWDEFFHAEDPLADEKEWREGLTKRSSQYDSFSEWQDWFKNNYAQVYKDNNIWMCILLTAWAHTHQYDVRFSDDSWEFCPSRSYLPTSQVWRLEPHMVTIIGILKELWQNELRAYETAGFTIDEQTSPFLGRVECLGFDKKKYFLCYPPRAQQEKEELNPGELIAEIALPVGDSWYRHLDNIIFAFDAIDASALINRARYIFGSHRRLYELAVDHGIENAKAQAAAEGWLVGGESAR